MNDKEILSALYATVENRRDNPKEGSYTCYLLDKGIDKILKKVGEECSETIIAAKNGDNGETVYEISDLIYHLMVMMVSQGIPLDDVLKELDKRSEKTGNLKTFHVVDKNS
ncbi:phosphoribosyl-ATP diphosphatase [Ruminococcus sp.]|uniref:phosphoribosyl-ATP diphosphatase n=1 Tax=Ruminococcus sp. TaxID=41978 RepID=UPI00262F69CE|nr:phosphoribosyl-ATP diphosphatase [Ruminococcus sp.]MDD6988801.1 phosphoribosyl-ATP diphosphatase [Ruminococcus sp.]MDY6202697.1 phosphoribosyl-ATP diphosphatase [Ruminococcus sp.]